MKLIFENDSYLSYSVNEELNEASGISEKKYRIKGVFSTIGEKNRNGRIYPRQIWESEISKYQNNFATGSLNLLCEWQHPPRSKVDPMEAVAKIEKLYIKDRYVMGEAVLLNNDKANQLKSLIDAGIKLSVSSRGVGSVKNGIVENFNLITYDLVDEPSDYAATMNGMVESYQLTEGVLEEKEFEVKGSEIVEVQVCSNNVCHMFEKTEVRNALKEKFEDFLRSLTGQVKVEENITAVDLPKCADAKSNIKCFRATFMFKDQKTQKTRVDTLYFESKEDAEKYGDIKGWNLSAIKVIEQENQNIEK